MAATLFARGSASAGRHARLDPEHRLTALGRSAGPLRRAVVALAGQLVTRRAWVPLGHARLGDYARERLGLSARSLQEFARVDRALAELPQLDAAFVSGRLPWSKVRMLARFASTGDEAGWITVAERISVRRLERMARAVDRGALESGAPAVDEEGRDAETCEWVRLGAPAPLAFKWRRTIEAAAKVAGETCTAAGALEWVTAETLAALPTGLDREARKDERGGSVGVHHGSSGDAGGGWGALEPSSAESAGDGTQPCDAAGDAACRPECIPESPASRPPPWPRFLSSLVEGLEQADAVELDARLRRALRLEQRLDAEIAPLLRRVTAADYEWIEGFQTLADCARDRLGMSPRKARALVRLERVGDVCPELRAGFRNGRLSWVQAQILAPLLLWDAEGDWRRAWVDFASRVTVRRLEAVVDHVLGLREADLPRWERGHADPEWVDAAVPGGAADRGATGVCNASGDGARGGSGHGDARQTCARPTDSVGGVQIRVYAPRDVAHLFHAVLCSVRRALERRTGRLPTPAEGFEAMVDHAIESWRVDDRFLRRTLRQRHAIFERDGWRCTVPGCTSRRNLQAHHVVFRSAGGPDTPANQTTLCAHHHHRGVHGGTVRIKGAAPHDLCFELGTRPGQPPVARYRSGDRLA